MARGFKIKILVCLGLLLTFGLNANRAAAEPRVYVTSHFKIIADGTEIHCSWWSTRCDFGHYFDENADAKTEYDKYQKIAAYSPWLRWAAVAAFLAYGIYELGSDHNWDFGTSVVVFGVPWLGGAWISGAATSHLIHAVNLMNGVPPENASSRTFRDTRSADRLAALEIRGGNVPMYRTTLFQYTF